MRRSSPAPREGDASYAQYLEELDALFDRFAEEREGEGGVTRKLLPYSLRTTLHVGRLDGDL